MKAMAIFLLILLAACSGAKKEKEQPTADVIGDSYTEINKDAFVSMISSFVIASYGLEAGVHMNQASVDSEIKEYMEVHNLAKEEFEILRARVLKEICSKWPEELPKEKSREWECSD